MRDTAGSAERILGIGMTDRPPDDWPDVYGVFYPDRSTPVPADELPLAKLVEDARRTFSASPLKCAAGGPARG